MSEAYRPENEPEQTGKGQADPEGFEQEKKNPEIVSFRLIEGKPVVTYALIGVTALMYLMEALSKWRFGRDYPLELGAKWGFYITYYHQYWRLITPVFLHGSLMHILFNMYSLFTLGPALEHYYGHWNFLRFYLICGFTGNVLSYVASPSTLSVGASTALFGLIAAQAMFFYKNRRILRNYRRALQNILFVILVNLAMGMQGGIDNWGHLGGLIGGALLSYLCGPELAFLIDPERKKPVLIDTVPVNRREISCALVTIFFAVLAFAFRRS